jgi:hypothetical protein
MILFLIFAIPKSFYIGVWKCFWEEKAYFMIVSPAFLIIYLILTDKE